MKHPLVQSRNIATGMLLASTFSVQIGATMAKQLFPLIGVRAVIALRVSLAALMLCLLHRPWRSRLVRAAQMTILTYGIVLSMMNILIYFALARIPLGIAVALEFTGPLSVAIFTSRHALDVLWTALALCGVLLLLPITSFSTPLDPIGVLYSIGAGVCWGLYIVVGKYAGSTIPSGVVTAWGMCIGSCIVLPISLIHAGHISLTPSILWHAMLVAVLSSAIPYSLEMSALKRLPAKTFSIFMSSEPAVAAVLGLVLLHEHLVMSQWIAIGCVITASFGSTATAIPQAVQV